MNGYGIVKFHNDWILRRRRQTLLEGLNNPYLIRAAVRLWNEDGIRVQQ